VILLCFGTRPEWLKIKPVIQKLNRSQYRLLFTGQHPDLLKDLDVDHRIQINQSNNRLDQLISDCIIQFPDGDFDSVLVQGDTASAFACALAAFNRQLKIYYLESGLRSYDMRHPYPEEAYRQMISRIADVNFCPTSLSKTNLEQERVNGTIHITGNTALDNLVELKNECEYLDKVLITLHRRENHFWLDQWFLELEKLAKENPTIEFILPIHPNPNVQKHRHLLEKVKVIDPLPHEDLLSILVKCKLVISDSGGIQEEGSFFNKKVIVCRKATERPEAIYTNHLYLCDSPNHLKDIFYSLLTNHHINNECPYGDGYAAKKVLQIIRNEI
jgi:UDP-N-acetylglucosamine 2-epimerase (non-hydrolysing)